MRRNPKTALLFVVVALAAAVYPVVAQNNHGLKPVPGAYFVTLAPATDRVSLRHNLRGLGVDLRHEYALQSNRLNVRGVGAGVLAQLRGLPGVVSVTPDYEVHPALAESVPLIGALADDPEMAGTDGGAGKIVCVLDTGINPDHIMFGPNRIQAWRDFANGLPDPYDDDADSHGSNVAGIIAGRTGLTLGGLPFQGVAPSADLYVGKVLPGTFGDLQAAIDWCAGVGPGAPNPPADVINMSLGGGAFSTVCDSNDPTGTAAYVNAAAAAGILVVSAAGNERNQNAVLTPACASGSMAIGATYDADVGRVSFQGCTDRRTQADKICCFSNHWSFLDVVAPGCISTSAVKDAPTSVAGICGTSQAAPHVSGLAALVMASNPGMTATDVRNRINSTAKDLGSGGFDSTYGNGRIEAGPAVNGIQCDPFETSCTDGDDNDCDTFTDCDDTDCASDPACQCLPAGSSCTSNGECCSNSCKGKPGNMTCK